MRVSSVRSLVARAAFAPVLVFAIIACEDALSPPDDLGPSYSDTVVNRIQVPVDGNVFNPCSGERVDFEGTLTGHELQLMGGTSTAQFCLRILAGRGDIVGTGPGEDGATYRVVAFSRQDIPQGVSTEVDINRLQFVSTDGGGVFFANATLTILVSQGKATLLLEVTDIEGCRGGRH